MLRSVLAAALLLSGSAFAAADCGACVVSQQDPQAAYTKLAKDFADAMAKHQDELKAKVDAARKAGERVPRAAYRGVVEFRRGPTVVYLAPPLDKVRAYIAGDEYARV